jgi:hypothetical protein
MINFEKLFFLDDVRDFYIESENTQFFCDLVSGGLVGFDTNFNNFFVCDEHAFHDLNKSSKGFHVSGGNLVFHTKTLKYENEKISTLESGDYLYFIDECNERVLFSIENDSLKDLKIFTYDWDKKINSQLPIYLNFPKMIVGDKVLSRESNNTWVCFSFTEKKIVWELNFNEILGGKDGRLNGDIMYSNERLFFTIYDVKDANLKSGCFIVDIETGRVIHQCELFGGYLKNKSETELFVINSTKFGTRKKNYPKLLIIIRKTCCLYLIQKILKKLISICPNR